ncbi:hypothetical protein K3N28_13605 [Glycomyces sp. TRM65418]|uniref:hypothetical protein n=1 Tax=Glycomyces sp. TRM65418 TaxID=2867006 RepID=UPI001CE4CD41|nr:hypothetical protein [Glycomyces sp. TRM65418]MCC3764102.1 hypothetical protein [Glycomyces sp. TRM65418]QZD53790.1 hypothetical protein K3N28_13540 [Glycomyces sp. TRM65418]
MSRLDGITGDESASARVAAGSDHGSERLVSDGLAPIDDTSSTSPSKVEALKGPGRRVRAARAVRAGSVPGSAVWTADRAARSRSRRFRTRPAGQAGELCAEPGAAADCGAGVGAGIGVMPSPAA